MATLYRNYDRAALDIQYNARATVPDIQPILKKYAEDSAEARRTLDCALDVPFGEHADESLDIFPAAAARATRRCSCSSMAATGACCPRAIPAAWRRRSPGPAPSSWP